MMELMLNVSYVLINVLLVLGLQLIAHPVRMLQDQVLPIVTARLDGLMF